MAQLTDNRPNHVYIIRTEGTNFYKIGRTKNVEQRIYSLRTANPYPVEVVLACRIDEAFKVEAYLHYKLQRYSIRGEWFELPKDILDKIKDKLYVLDKPCTCKYHYQGKYVEDNFLKTSLEEVISNVK